MLNRFEIILFSFRLIGLKYSAIIFFSISLTLGLLLFAQSILKGYEQSLLIKIIGSTPHISMLFDNLIDEKEVGRMLVKINKTTSIKFSAKGLAYSGTADIFTVGIKDSRDESMNKISSLWEKEELKSQSPEVFFKGMVLSPKYADYLEKILIGFDHAEKDKIPNVNRIYTYKSPKDWDDALSIRKPIAFPPSLYREIIDPYITQANYPYIRFTEFNKNFGGNNFKSKLEKESIEFVVVSTLDTPISDDTVPIVTAYETIKYLLKGTTKGINIYNYLEFFLNDPMSSVAAAKQLKQLYGQDVYISAWSDKYKSEMALINIFNFLLFSVMIGTGISIALLLSSLLDITVRRKRRQVSILLAIGSERQLIVKIFIYYSLFLGLLGYMAGIAVAKIIEVGLFSFINVEASVFKNHIYLELLHSKLQNIPEPAGVNFYSAVIILISVLIISFLSSYQSAIEGSKINPIEGLKES